MLDSPRFARALLTCVAGFAVTSCGGTPTGIMDGGADSIIENFCVNSLDCVTAPAGKQICDKQVGQCVQCVIKADCPANNDCIAHSCVEYVPCADSSTCGTGTVCDTAAGKCVECLVDADCGDQKRCADNSCRPACASDNECTPLGLLCNQTSGYCVACMTHQDCEDSQYCAAGLCKPDTCQAGQTACIDNGLATCNSAGDGFGAPVSCGGSSCVLAATGARCEAGNPDAGADAPVGDGGTDTANPTTCTATATDFGCSVIPRFPLPATSQVLDGIGDEFAGVRAVTFSAANAPFREGHSNGDPPPTTSFPEQITFRAAWSPEAFHVHVRVTDTNLFVNSGGNLWDGDAVDILIASSDTFQFGGSATCSANAMQMEVGPSTTPTSIIYASGTGQGVVPTEWYATRITSDAYEMEFRIPWQAASVIPAAGSKIGFHLGVSLQNTAGAGRELWVTLPIDASLTTDGGGCAGMSTEQAWCDSRAWCRPTLSEQSCPSP